MGKLRPFAVTLSATVLSGVLTGCSAAEPEAAKSAEGSEPVKVLVASNSTEDRVVAEIFRQTLESADRKAEIVEAAALDDAPVDALRTGSADLWLACTGETLDEVNHQKAQELEPEYEKVQAGKIDEDFVAVTHVALISSLPPELQTVDPSGAEGCKGDSDVDLPQNYTPIFSKQVFDRDERNLVTSVAKFVTGDDIEDLADDAEDRVEKDASNGGSRRESTDATSAGAIGKAVRQVVERWMESEVPAAEINEGTDSDDNADTDLS